MTAGNKKAPAGQTAKGPNQTSTQSYHSATGLSIAADIILLLTQTRVCARQQRRNCLRSLEELLQQYYSQRGVNDGA